MQKRACPSLRIVQQKEVKKETGQIVASKGGPKEANSRCWVYLVVDDGLHEGGDVLLRLEAEVALENFHEGVALQCATQPAVLRKRQRQGRAIQSWVDEKTKR